MCSFCVLSQLRKPSPAHLPDDERGVEAQEGEEAEGDGQGGHHDEDAQDAQQEAGADLCWSGRGGARGREGVSGWKDEWIGGVST